MVSSPAIGAHRYSQNKKTNLSLAEYDSHVLPGPLYCFCLITKLLAAAQQDKLPKAKSGAFPLPIDFQ
jgi:hypothetical protein